MRVIPVDGHCEDVLQYMHRTFTKPQWNRFVCSVLPTDLLWDLAKKKPEIEFMLWDLGEEKPEIEFMLRALAKEKPKMDFITLDELVLECRASKDCVKKVMTYTNYSDGIYSGRIRDPMMVENIVKDIQEDALNIDLCGQVHVDGVSRGFLERMSGTAVGSEPTHQAAAHSSAE